jgi:hypothetical protein
LSSYAVHAQDLMASSLAVLGQFDKAVKVAGDLLSQPGCAFAVGQSHPVTLCSSWQRPARVPQGCACAFR